MGFKRLSRERGVAISPLPDLFPDIAGRRTPEASPRGFRRIITTAFQRRRDLCERCQFKCVFDGQSDYGRPSIYIVIKRQEQLRRTLWQVEKRAALTGTPEDFGSDLHASKNRLTLILTEIAQEQSASPFLRELNQRRMISPQQFFQPHALPKAAVIDAILAENVSDEPGREFVIRFQWHDPRAVTPMLVLCRVQTFADPADRVGLFVLDSHDGIPPDVSLRESKRGSGRQHSLHALVRQRCFDEDTGDGCRPLGTNSELLVGFAVESQGQHDARVAR